MKVVKNITFKVPDSQFLNRGFVVRQIDLKDANIKSILKWNPITIKADYKIKLVNSHTEQYMRHSLTRVEISPDKKWVIAYWNPYELIDNLTKSIPTIIGASILMGVISSIKQSITKQTQPVNKEVEK